MSKATDDYKKLSIDDTIKELQTSRSKGLSQEESQKRLSEYGYNEIPEKEESTFRRVFRRFWGPISWMIEIAAILSALVGRWEDFTIIMILLFTNAFIDLWQEGKALNALKVLKQKLAKETIVLRDGEFNIIDVRNLVIGDIIKLKIGDIVPADVKLIHGDFIQVDQSALTGESLPVNKEVEDIAYSNSIVKQGDMLAVVVNTALNTFFGKTVALVAKAEREERSHFQKAVINIGNFLIIISMFLVAIIIITAVFRHENMFEILRFCLVLTVSAIPVALPAVLSVTLAVGAMNLAKKQAIVTRLVSIEELAGVDVLCADKTGTLTQNKMTVSEPVVFGNHTVDELMVYAALASREENKDPIEIPIFEYLDKAGLQVELNHYEQLKFKPFDPVSKRTESHIKQNSKTLVVTKGAAQVVLGLCGKNVDEKEVQDKVEYLAERGFRTLAVAIKSEDRNFDFIGLIPLYDPPREDSKATIEEAKKLGLDVKMVTGDNSAIARYIANILSIGENIMNARDLHGASEKELVILGEIIANALYRRVSPGITEEEAKQFAKSISKEFENIQLPKGYVKQHESEIIELIEDTNVFAQVLPEDKYLIVDKLQKSEHIVGMTGDGVNDAPALKKADAGIAVSGATDAARAAADVVLLAPGLLVIIDAIKMARITFERMKSYSIYRIAETIRIILFMTASIVIFNFYPITTIMIIILALLNDIPILSIAYDNTKVDDKPVKWNMKEVMTVATVLGVLGVVSSFLIFFILEEYMHFSGELIQSLIFLKLVVAGHATIYLTRTESFFWKKPYPSLILFSATFSTRVLGTIFAVYGWFVMSVGWEWAIYIWIYSTLWFIFNDFVKIWTYKLMRRNELALKESMV